MYQLLNVISKGEITGYRFTQVETENMSLSTIFNLYTKTYLVLRSPFLEDLQYVDLDSIRSTHSNSPLTLLQFLIDNGNNTLSTVETIPSTDAKIIQYSDAVFAGYKIEQCRIGVSVEQNLPETHKKDLYINSTDRDAKLLHKYALVSVNGYFHNTDVDNRYTYVIDGAKSMFRSNHNNVGITSFYNIGEITKRAISLQDIYKEDDRPLHEKLRIKLPASLDVSNKVLFLVLGGYMVLPAPNLLTVATDKSLVLNLQALPYYERLVESSKILDLRNIGLDTNFTKNDVITDEFIKQYLTISQSFVVVLDTDHIFYSKLSLDSNNLPGIFTSYQEPTLPLFTGYGRLTEYWKTYNDGVWTLNARETQARNYMFSTLNDTEKRLLSEHQLVRENFKVSNGFLLEIGTQ